jgi:hypothetical protein
MKQATYFLFLFSMIGSQIVTAQVTKNDTIGKRNVIIEREYTPTAPDVTRLMVSPIVTEPEIKPEPVTFSDQLSPLQPAFDLHKWQAAVVHIDQDPIHKGYALLGGGWYGTALGELLLPIVNNNTQQLIFNTHLWSLFGNKQQHLVTNFGLDYKYSFTPFDLSFGAYFNREGFNYYGTNGSSFQYLPSSTNYKDTTNHFVNGGFKVAINSHKNPSNIDYSLQIKYNSFVPGFGLHEQQIDASGNVEVPINENRLGVLIDVADFSYNQPSTTSYPSYAVIGVNPYFNLLGNSWEVHIGLKDDVTTGGSNRKMNLMPDVTAHIDLIPTVTAYGGITGSYQINSMQNMMDNNHYLLPTLRVRDSYVPIDAFAGIKSSPLTGLLLNGSIDYKQYDKQYFYINASSDINAFAFPTLNNWSLPMFDVVYDNAHEVTLHFNSNYNWRDEQFIFLEANYHYWNTQTISHAWMQPSFEFCAGIDQKVTQHLSLNANYYFGGGRYAALLGNVSVSMKNINDVNFGASYSYSNWLTAFARVNNILSLAPALRYQTWYGYDAVNCNFQVGVAFSF